MITIIVLYILLGIIALIVILLHFSVRLRLSAKSGQAPVIEVRWLFFKFYPRKKSEKNTGSETEFKSEFSEEEINDLILQAEKSESAEQVTAEEIVKQDSSDELPPKKPEKAEEAVEAPTENSDKPEGGLKKVKRYYVMAKPYIPMAWKNFKKLLKKIRFTKLDVLLISGKDDAYEAAMLYGKLNAVLYNLAALLSRIFTIRVKNLRIGCKYNEKYFEYDVSTEVMVRPSTIIAIVFCVGVNFLGIWLRQKFKAWSERRHRRKEEKLKSKIEETELLTNERTES